MFHQGKTNSCRVPPKPLDSRRPSSLQTQRLCGLFFYRQAAGLSQGKRAQARPRPHKNQTALLVIQGKEHIWRHESDV